MMLVMTTTSRKKLSPLAIVLTLSSVFFILFLMVTGGIYLYKAPGGGAKGGKHGAASFLAGSGEVGVIELNGVFMDSKKTLTRLEKFEDDDSIKAVVLRLNSPGGSVAPSQEIYEAVRAYKKPLVVSMSSVAASGAYYIACGAKKVYANAGTITGSIGVIMEFINLKKLYEWAKVERYAIKTGKFKDVGAEYKEMNPEERELLQTMVNDVLSQFKQAVSTGRKLNLEQVTLIADGRIFSGAQAKAAHLVDELGTLQDAVNEAAKEAGIKGKPQIVYPDRADRRWLDLVLDGSGRGDDASESYAGGAASSLFERVARAVLGTGAAEALDPLPKPGIYWLWKGAR
jgi:protease-4